MPKGVPQLRSVQPRQHVEDLQRTIAFYTVVPGVEIGQCCRRIVRRARCGSRPTPGLVTVEWGPEVYADGRREFAIRDPDGKLVILSGETDDPVRPDD